MRFLNKLRLKLIKKLLKPDDGYTYTGFSEGEPIKFYYQESTKMYLLGQRRDTMYYFKPTLTSWASVSSIYLPWVQMMIHHMEIFLHQIYLGMTEKRVLYRLRK